MTFFIYYNLGIDINTNLPESNPTMPMNKEAAALESKILSQDHDLLAYFLQALACVVWTTSYIYTNEHNFNTFEVNIAKGIVGTILNYFVLAYRGYNNNF